MSKVRRVTRAEQLRAIRKAHRRMTKCVRMHAGAKPDSTTERYWHKRFLMGAQQWDVAAQDLMNSDEWIQAKQLLRAVYGCIRSDK